MNIEDKVRLLVSPAVDLVSPITSITLDDNSELLGVTYKDIKHLTKNNKAYTIWCMRNTIWVMEGEREDIWIVISNNGLGVTDEALGIINKTLDSYKVRLMYLDLIGVSAFMFNVVFKEEENGNV